MIVTTQGCNLPQFVRDLLASTPRVGEGMNAWLFRVARVLHPYRNEHEIVALLQSSTHGERVRQSEIERAVKNSKAAAWQPGEPTPNGGNPSKWPAVNEAEIARVSAGGVTALQLIGRSPVPLDAEDEPTRCEAVLTALLVTSDQSDPLVCVGKSNSEFYTRRLSVLLAKGKLSTLALVVPSPMSKRSGTTKEGRKSEHCLDNTGPRRFLVVEFDKGTADDHAARLWHLSGYAPLALVVHSGGKSLHGWFYCQGQDETALRKFMAYAVSIGADDATWTRSQFVRMPSGQRDTETRQSVFFFNPDAIK